LQGRGACCRKTLVRDVEGLGIDVAAGVGEAANEEEDEEEEDLALGLDNLLCDSGRRRFPDFQSFSLCLFSKICTIRYSASRTSRSAILAASSTALLPCCECPEDAPVK